MRKQVDIVNQSELKREDDVLESIHAVMHQYRSQQYRVLRDGPHPLTHMESKVLGFFGRHAGATQSDLVQHSGRDKAQLARLIKGLRERGLLVGQADAADRRTVRLSLSADGQTVQKALQQQARVVSRAAVAGLTPAQHRQLLDLLQQVRRNLDANE